MTAIKGYASQGRISNQTNRENFSSVLLTDPINRAGLEVAPRYLFPVSLTPLVAEQVDPADFPTYKTPELRIVKYSGHSFRRGDVIRFTNGDNIDVEVSVDKIENDYLYLAGELEADPFGDEFLQMRFMTLTLSNTGGLITTSGPVQFVLDGVAEEVTEDTAVPANNMPLPVKIMPNVTYVESVLEGIHVALPSIPVATRYDTTLAVPAGFRATALEIFCKAGDSFTAYDDALAGNVLGRFTQAGGKIPVNMAAGTEIHLQAAFADFDATDLMINIIGVPL